ncbi:hypothetical protein pb186bvf_000290 [Paramecium bursaria]
MEVIQIIIKIQGKVHHIFEYISLILTDLQILGRNQLLLNEWPEDLVNYQDYYPINAQQYHYEKLLIYKQYIIDFQKLNIVINILLV